MGSHQTTKRVIGLRAARGVLIGVMIYLVIETLGAQAYRRILEPESLAGLMDLVLRAELQRPETASPRIAIIGNSRLAEGFSAKIATAQAAGKMVFSNLSVPATTPRCWYYFLRDVDPNANRFRAIVLQTDLYSDEDGDVPSADEIGDLHGVVAFLRPTDSFDFAFSYLFPRFQFQALRGALLKGYVFKQDVQALLEAPAERLRKVALFREGHHNWAYDYEGHSESLKGLAVDWKNETMSLPPGVPDAVAKQLRAFLLRKRSPQTGAQRRYRQLWLGRIVDRYRSSETRVVFLRVPRGPAINPITMSDQGPSIIRDLARSTGVIALEADTFNSLETPETFWDAVHMNRSGREQFSRMLANELASGAI